ncbi:hypothetical protein K456DRAFT_120048 [Colletotrichum gloeosporioides 23]|nr:hypothetical protein K456DRAFT_120048 [Colletotrichum gloeosporioides 23]
MAEKARVKSKASTSLREQTRRRDSKVKPGQVMSRPVVRLSCQSSARHSTAQPAPRRSLTLSLRHLATHRKDNLLLLASSPRPEPPGRVSTFQNPEPSSNYASTRLSSFSTATPQYGPTPRILAFNPEPSPKRSSSECVWTAFSLDCSNVAALERRRSRIPPPRPDATAASEWLLVSNQGRSRVQNACAKSPSSLLLCHSLLLGRTAPAHPQKPGGATNEGWRPQTRGHTPPSLKDPSHLHIKSIGQMTDSTWQIYLLFFLVWNGPAAWGKTTCSDNPSVSSIRTET